MQLAQAGPFPVLREGTATKPTVIRRTAGPGGEQSMPLSWKGRPGVGPGRPGGGISVLRGVLLS